MRRVIKDGEKLWFGKYKGKTVGEIAQFNPQYLLWVHAHACAAKLSEGDLAYVIEKAEAPRGFSNSYKLYTLEEL